MLQPHSDTDPVLDELLVKIGEALEVDPTLGGLCEWAEPEAPVPVEVPIDGAPTMTATVVPVALTYVTTGPLA